MVVGEGGSKFDGLSNFSMDLAEDAEGGWRSAARVREKYKGKKESIVIFPILL